MCSTPSMPEIKQEKKEEVAAPTQADAAVTKAAQGTRDKNAKLSARDIKTAPRGLEGVAKVQNKKLLGE